MLKYVTFNGNEKVLGIDDERAAIIDQEAFRTSISDLAKLVAESSLELSQQAQRLTFTFETVLRGCVVEHVQQNPTDHVFATDVYLTMQTGLKPSVKQPTSVDDFVVHFAVQVEWECLITSFDDVEVTNSLELMRTFDLALEEFHQKVEALLS